MSRSVRCHTSVLVLVSFACGGDHGPRESSEDAGPASTLDSKVPDSELHDAAVHTGDGGHHACDPAGCDDGDPCNGSERCVQGACTRGEPACAQVDTRHCQVSCIAHSREASCEVAALDRDRDGHGDARCVLGQNATDCDDEHATVHPGAPELCDGLDNDCDGELDVQDGLELGGEQQPFGRGTQASVAWSGEHSFGVAYVRDEALWLQSVDLAGDKVHEARLLSAADAQQGAIDHPHIAWGGDHFGVSYSRSQALGFRRAQRDGTPLGDELDVGPEGFALYGKSLLARPQGRDWVVAFECCQSRPTLHARSISANGKMSELVTVSDQPASALSGLAASGDELAALWVRYFDPTHTFVVELGRHGADLSALAPPLMLASEALPGAASFPVLSAAHDGEGYAVAWRETLAEGGTRHFHYAELDRAGNTLCGPIDLHDFYAAGAAALEPDQMVATSRGYVLVGHVWISFDNQTVELVEMAKGCRYRQRAFVANADTFPYPRVASAGDAGLMLLWTTGASDRRLEQRLLPAGLCE